MLFPVIMAGGSGTRLWPKSRSHYPKQFLSFFGNDTMLQETLKRLEGLEHQQPLIICNDQHRFIVAEQLRNIDYDNYSILLEPAGRNTAPAVALAAFEALSLDQDPILLVLAADHVIQDVTTFHDSIKTAIIEAEKGKLVTFGIIPTKPESGYGYIRKGDELNSGVNAVLSFVEKPDIITAQKYVESGEYLWNSGMFLFKASTYLNELGKYCPDILSACDFAYKNASLDLDFLRINESDFMACPEQSIDYAVMEKTEHCVVVPMDANWNDIGSWTSLWEISSKDENGNVIRGDTITHNSRNNYISAENALISTIGVEDLIIVQTKDAVLIADKNQVQDIKKIVASLKSAGRNEHITHREVYRPWGKYDSIDEGERYQVKRITVKPGEGLSLQMHHHRAEHWIVVAGTAKVTLGEEVKLLGENESIYIPLGMTHCLENPGKIPLDLIEVRSGTYLEEDDVVRFKDRYGRI